jgi:chemotaxis protein MotA
MLFIIGAVTVIGCVLLGYTMHGGDLKVLWQPTEFIIIIGAAVGSFIIGNAGKVQKGVLQSFKYLLKGAPYKKDAYIELLSMLYQVFKTMRSKGMLEIESHIENPSNSALFAQAPKFLKSHHAVDFLCDYLRLMTMGIEDHYQVEELMEKDLETSHHEHHEVSNAIITMGDAMPALGIVAAVLGVIVTMGSIDQPPAILGKLIGAALVGTFLGVLLSYGYVAPMGRYIGSYYEAEHKYLEVIKAALLAHLKGNAPVVSIEFARNVIPPKERPTFVEVENAVSNG